MKNLTKLLLPLFITGCAATYQPPTTKTLFVEDKLNATDQQIFIATKKALALEGLSISSAADGIITTSPTDYKASEYQADCGTTFGLNYLKDNRTETRVSYNVLISAGQLKIKAIIQGNYRPGEVGQDITLTCTSTGSLEQEMIEKIKENITSK